MGGDPADALRLRALTKEVARRTGRDRNTVRRALRSSRPPRYERPPRASQLEPFRDEIHRLLREDPKLPGQRVRELIEPLGDAGSKTILDDYLRRLRHTGRAAAGWSGASTVRVGDWLCMGCRCRVVG